jgi:pseudouridine synthase
MNAEPTRQPQDMRDETSLMRLHKLMAHAGVGSRRACESLIADGEVAVNGRRVTTSPVWVDPERDDVTVKGRSIRREERHVYVMLFKPKRTVSTVSDPSGRRTASELVDHPSGVRLYPVGRLDYDTTGLLLLTNDGALANRLTHPRYGIHKTYRAVVKGSLNDEDAKRLEEGIYLAQRKYGATLGGERLGAAEIRVARRDAERTILDITLTEGRNRQIRRLLAAVDCPVRKLTRIRMGPLSLKGLRLGEWRELTPREVRQLKRATKGAASRAERERRREFVGGRSRETAGSGNGAGEREGEA